jgi:hypothetical protein
VPQCASSFDKANQKQPEFIYLSPSMEPTDPASEQASTMFRPPVNRLMTILDRSFFRTSVPLAAARIFKPSDVSNVRKDLLKSSDLLTLPRVQGVHEVKDENGQVRKALLLREDVKPDGGLIGLVSGVIDKRALMRTSR